MKETVGKYWHVAVISLLISAVFFTWYNVSLAQPHDLRFVMLDVGQGDGLFIESPTGEKIIVDGGPGDALLSQLSEVMSPFDRSIDLIINTNPDLDHFEGFIPLLDRYHVGAFMEAGTNADDNPLWMELKKKIHTYNVPDIVAHRGQHIDIGGGVYIDILFPDRDVSALSHNDGSIVAKLVYGDTSVMLTGDSTQIIEKYLIHQYGVDQLKSDILKVGHHGSKTSSSEEFVQAVDPTVALISAGKNNSYGLPSPETLQMYEKNNIPYLITFNEGLIEYDSDGKNFVRVK